MAWILLIIHSLFFFVCFQFYHILLWDGKGGVAHAVENGAHNGFLQHLYSTVFCFVCCFFFLSIPLLIIPSIQFTFLIATEHWVDIFIELSIITPRSCFCVVITSQDHHCLRKIIFPIYITLHLSTMNFIFHFFISHSASCILHYFFQLAFIFTTLNKIISPANFVISLFISLFLMVNAQVLAQFPFGTALRKLIISSWPLFPTF